jgi:hypothetical protein
MREKDGLQYIARSHYCFADKATKKGSTLEDRQLYSYTSYVTSTAFHWKTDNRTHTQAVLRVGIRVAWPDRSLCEGVK